MIAAFLKRLLLFCAITELPADSQKALFGLFGNLKRVYEARRTPTYEAELETLPEQFRNNWHELLRWHAQGQIV